MSPRHLGRRAALALAGVSALLAASLQAPFISSATASNPATPGNFTGYGFDQCEAPSQSKMDTWWLTSPYAAVGIYISGDSRACRAQTNLTPTWVGKQLQTGWRLLPITLGPQASCTTRERYLKQVRISASTTNTYSKARSQGRAEADKTVAAAKRLGIPAKSTMFYDLEGFDSSKTTCRESAKYFLSAWTQRLHELGYLSGVYSSASSGMDMLDDARVETPGKFTLPDQLWIADWNGKADVYSSYISNVGWMPHKRVHQYRGGHNETHGGVTINIDNNWVDLGRGSWTPPEGKHCAGKAVWNHTSYPTIYPGSTRTEQVKTLQCLLKVKGRYAGAISGSYNAATQGAAVTWKRDNDLASTSTTFGRSAWMTLLTAGANPTSKLGSADRSVRRLQRGLNAAGVSHLRVTGIFDQATTTAVKAYQKSQQMKQYGVATPATWTALESGR